MNKVIDNKTTDIRNVVVECKLEEVSDSKEFRIDASIFDDILLEAATRFVEQHVKRRKNKIPPILTAYEKKDSKNYDNHYCYNTYYVVVNAGFYQKAEVIRKNFLMSTKIDLKKESIRGQNGNDRNNSGTNIANN